MNSIQSDELARNFDVREYSRRLPHCDYCGAVVPLPEISHTVKNTPAASCIVCGCQNSNTRERVGL